MITRIKESITNLLVVGANGGIGSHVVKLALDEGLQVTAVVRNPGSVRFRHERLTIVKGDVLQPNTFEKKLNEKSAIISAVGKNSVKPTSLYSTAAGNLLQCMKVNGAKRCFFISASGLEVNPTQNMVVRLGTRLILQKVFRNMYEDLFKMEAIIRESGLDWTIVRPPRLTDDPVTMNYRVSINAFVKNGLTISRADIAHFMLSNMFNTAIYQSTVEVAY